MFKKILVANRGEIAVRVMRTCREMDISTVAVFSEADRAALHVLYADEAYPIGPASPTESYLNIEKIVDLGRRTTVGHIQAGALGYNGHYANGLTAIFIACGPSSNEPRKSPLPDAVSVPFARSSVTFQSPTFSFRFEPVPLKSVPANSIV